MVDLFTRHAVGLLERFLDDLTSQPAPLAHHRTVMAGVRAALVAHLSPHSPRHGDPATLDLALGWAEELAGLADERGLFSSDGNLSSPPDSCFSLNDLGCALALLRAHPGGDPALVRLEEQLTGIATRALPALVAGGVHTPNHRWEVAAALVRLQHLHPDALARAEEWLAEGVDVDADGIYSERSANYAAHVSNPCLLVLSELLERPGLAEVVHRNLHTVLALTDDDGLVETVLSRRQDQHAGYPVGAFHLQLRRFALLEGCAECAAAAAPPERWVQDPAAGAEALAAALLEPRLDQDVVAAPPAPAPDGRRVLAAAGLVVQRRGSVRTVVYGGSDVPALGRVCSGAAVNPTLLRLRAGRAVLRSVRLSRTFFGLGPFRGTLAPVGPDGPLVLEETVRAGYSQPLPPAARRHDGVYPLGFEGRYAAAMDFPARERDEVELVTRMEVAPLDDGLRLTWTSTGAAAPWSLELCFDPGGTLEGVQPLDRPGEHLLTGGWGSYRHGGDRIDFGPGRPPGPGCPVGYHPGEAYTFLGGTDALGGPRVHLAGRGPGRWYLDLRPRPESR
ncbi:hypothetical protein [Auraticoccus monumenti]|uniref:Heparinase II/III-like protein n=1 Tax=Auraticoccus monumenti TaxID=675864 RepID=A0A1G7DCD8_9ACTN|nr:hypothetical protein [Auraticoccus monumenti]SDE49318.1 hypothetical protein SAMN04489747_3559 [Auraticoccus monumenti]